MIARLLRLMEQEWDHFDGWAVAQGFDPDELPLRRLLSVLYYWATKNGDENGIRKFEIKLYQPPKGEVPTVGPWSAEAEMAAFGALKAQTGL